MARCGGVLACARGFAYMHPVTCKAFDDGLTDDGTQVFHTFDLLDSATVDDLLHVGKEFCGKSWPEVCLH